MPAKQLGIAGLQTREQGEFLPDDGHEELQAEITIKGVLPLFL